MKKIKFNEQQLQVINHNKGPISVIAGAGSGKSTVLVHRIKKLIDTGVNQKDITAITFTKNSADDLKKKLNQLDILNVQVGTFHSVLSRMLQENGVNVFKNIPQFEVKKKFNQVEFNADIEDILSFISFQKCYMKSQRDVFVAKESKYTDYELAKFYDLYEEAKRDLGAYDFDDWMLEALKILKVKPGAFHCEYLLVDEHQDNNMVQNLLIREMCPNQNIMVVGDYRQSIYGFRGAEPKYFMNFHNDYPQAKVVHLDNNYRSCAEIIHKSNNFIKNYFGEYEHYSDSVPTVEETATIQFEVYDTVEDECEEIANQIHNMILAGKMPKDIAILYRMNNMAQDVELALIKRNIPYHVENDNNFFKSKHIIPIISTLRLIENFEDDEALVDLMKTRCYPFTYLPKSVLTQIEQFAFENGCSYLDAGTMAPIGQKHNQTFVGFQNMLSGFGRQYRMNKSALIMTQKIIFSLKLQNFIESTWRGEEVDRRKNSIKSFMKFTENTTVESFLKFVQHGKRTAKKQNENAVQLMTIHRSKGLEWDNVFLVGLQETKFPSQKAPIEEEARLFYVAVTRPRDFLHISQIGEFNTFGHQYRGLEIKKKNKKVK